MLGPISFSSFTNKRFSGLHIPKEGFYRCCNSKTEKFWKRKASSLGTLSFSSEEPVCIHHREIKLLIKAFPMPKARWCRASPLQHLSCSARDALMGTFRAPTWKFTRPSVPIQRQQCWALDSLTWQLKSLKARLLEIIQRQNYRKSFTVTLCWRTRIFQNQLNDTSTSILLEPSGKQHRNTTPIKANSSAAEKSSHKKTTALGCF